MTMHLLKPLSICTGLISITCIFIACIFFIYGRNKIHKLWAIFNLNIAGWTIFITLASLSTSPENAYRFWIAAHAVAAFIAAIFYHCMMLFCHQKKSKLIRIAYVYATIGFLGTLFLSERLYNGTLFLFGSIHYLDANPIMFPVYMINWAFLVVIATFRLYEFSKESKTLDARILLTGCSIGFLGGLTTLLPMLGFHSYYPFTIIGVLFYAIINTYATFRHQIFELKIVYKTSLVYSCLLAIITIGYLLIIVYIEKSLGKILGYQSISISLFFAFLIGILFIPLRNMLNSLIDKLFLKGSPFEILNENRLLRQRVIDKDKFEFISTLASGIAHDIKNPLTAIKTYFEHFPQKKDDPQFLEDFQRIVGPEINRINDLTNNLLEFAKPSALHLKETRIQNLLNNCLNLLQHQIKKNNVLVVKQIENTEPIQADPNKLTQVFLNLILNAIEAMPDGGTLTILTKSHKDQIEIEIMDTGIGIAPKDIKNIFNPFFTQKEKGTGLGLAIVEEIINEHGGEIEVKSEEQKGSTFKLRFILKNSA